VVIEKINSTHTEPAKLAIWCKLNVHNYQYVHRWEFHGDGRIEVSVGVGGELLGTDTIPSFRKINHVHNFYVRLDFFELGDNAGALVEEQVVSGGVTNWQSITVEGKHTVVPSQYTRWRVRDAARTNQAGLPRSYEIIPSSVDPPDGTNSTGDFWVINRKGEVEMGAEVATEDNATDNYLASGYGTGAALGPYLVVWTVLRERHTVDPNGEDHTTVPYHFETLTVRPRDFLDDTPKGLYVTNPTSP
jgi:Cu2+-containing amine oxidase